MKRFVLYMIIICFVQTCGLSKKNDIKKIVQEWQSKEIIIPDQLTYKILGKDTLCDELWKSPFRIFTYIDSIGCTSCRLRLPEWKALIDSCREQSIDVSFIFAVHSSDFKRFTNDVKFHEFDEPIIYDFENRFYRLNRFPDDPYRTFLLNHENRVLLIGDPIGNPHLWQLYKKTIKQSK